MKTLHKHAETKTYGEACVRLDEGVYTISELRELIARLEKLNAANKHLMQQIKWSDHET